MKGLTKILLISIVFLTTNRIGYAQSMTEIERKGIASTVSIVSLDKNLQPLGFGSGFIVDNQTVITNFHVIEGANKSYKTLAEIILRHLYPKSR